MNFAAWTLNRVSRCVSSLFPLFIVAVCFLFMVQSSQGQTNINIGSTVIQSGAKHLGINLANQNFYDSGQMLRNLIFRNPGFEGQTWRSVLVCRTITPTTCQDDNPYTTWTANFMQGAKYTFMTGPAAGVSGVITGQDISSYAAGSGNYGVKIHYAAPSIQPRAGDFIKIEQTFPGNGQAGWWIENQNGGAISTDTTAADQAPGTTGTQCLKVTGSAGQGVNVVQYFDTLAGHSFVQLNGSYTVTFKAKSLGGNNQFNLQVAREENPAAAVYLNQTVNLTGSWANYSYTFNAAENGSALGNAKVSFNFNGNNALLDDVQMSSDKNTYGTAYRDEVVSTLMSLKPGVIRYMDTSQGLGSYFDNMIKDQYGRQRSGWSTQGTQIDNVPVGLFEFLQLCQVVGAEPWWTMPVATSKTEMQHIMEYMAGSSSTPYGAIRAAQGQTAPWTTVFPVIHMELGNEVWNSASFRGETMQDPFAFGQWANTTFGAAKASPYYSGNNSKFDFVMGTFENDGWTQQEMDSCPTACDSVALAPYIFGSLSDTSSIEAIFGPLMAEGQWMDTDGTALGGVMWNQTQVAAGNNVHDTNGTKYPKPMHVYEVQMSTATGTATQAAVNSTVTSVAAGISNANHMLMMLRDLGVKTQNMFALTEYQNGWAGPNAKTTPVWGTVVDMGGPTNLKRPQFLAEALSNTAILPTVLQTTHSGDDPTWNQPFSVNDSVQLNNAHYLQSYAFTDGTNSSVVVFNLHRSASLPVIFTGANGPRGNVVIQQLTSGQITDTNEVSPKVNITNRSVSNANPGTSYSLPPFSMTVFLWPGTTLPASNTSLSATPQAASPGQSVSLSAVVTSQSGTRTPTGTITFLDGNTSLGTGTLDNNGAATFSTTSLAGGTHSITASYSGDDLDSNSVSAPVTVTISGGGGGGGTRQSTTTTLNLSPASSTSGQNVTFSANVSSSSGGNVTGTVELMDGSTVIGSGSVGSSGVAVFNDSRLAVGSHSVVAIYSGDNNDNTSSSAPVTELVSATPGANPGVLADGIYTLVNHAALTYLDDPDSSTSPVQIVQTRINGGLDQKWIFKSDGNGSYTIQSLASHLYLTSPLQSNTPGTPLMQQSPTNDDWQLWELVPSGSSYQIQNKASGLAMDYTRVLGINLYPPSGGHDQGWFISATTDDDEGQLVPNGDYLLTNLFTAGVLDDPGSSTVEGLQITQDPRTGNPEQRWRFTYQPDGSYTIKNLASGQFLTSPQSSTTPGVPLVQQHATGDGWQSWKLVPNGGGYLLQNVSSGLFIDYPGAVGIAGIDLWPQSGGDNQMWTIAP